MTSSYKFLKEVNFKITLDKIGFVCYNYSRDTHVSHVSHVNHVDLKGDKMDIGRLDFESPKSLYTQLTEIIEKQIISNDIAVGQKLPSEEKLRKMYKVSIDTVREALSNLVKEGLIARRRSYGTYVISSEPKRSLNLEKKNGICLVACQLTGTSYSDAFSHPHYYKVIKGVEEKVREKSCYMIYSTLRGKDLEIGGKEKEIAGLIITGDITHENYGAIKKSKIPYVLIGDVQQSTATVDDVDIIADDDRGNVRKTTKYLIDLGHEKIVYLASSLSHYYFQEEHFKGYIEAMKESGILCNPSMQIETGKYSFESGYDKMKEFLTKSVPFTALLCTSNIIAFGAMKAIMEKGLRVPEDISVIGGISPELTSIENDSEEAGRVAVERLIERLTNPYWQPRRIVVPGKIIVRKSTRRLEKQGK
jgi:LacI family transcriptional regulator